MDGTVPPPVGAYIQAVVGDAQKRGDLIHECVVLGFDGDIVRISPQMPFLSAWVLDRYRVRKPKALRDLIALVESLLAPAPQPERVQA